MEHSNTTKLTYQNYLLVKYGIQDINFDIFDQHVFNNDINKYKTYIPKYKKCILVKYDRNLYKLYKVIQKNQYGYDSGPADYELIETFTCIKDDMFNNNDNNNFDSLPDRLTLDINTLKSVSKEIGEKFHYLVKIQNIDLIVEFLDNNITSVNYQNINGSTALMIAAQKNNFDLVKILVEKYGADANIRNKENSPALFFTHSNTTTDIFEYLEKMTDYNINEILHTNQGKNFLHLAAACEENEEIMKLLVQRKDIDINKQSNDGYTALHLACYHNPCNAKVLLTHNDIDINKKSDCGDTAIIFAMKQHNYYLAIIIAERKDFYSNVADKYGRTPIMHSIYYDLGLFTSLLNNKNININIQDMNGKTVLMLALETKNTKAVNMLINRKDLNINLTDANGDKAINFSHGSYFTGKKDDRDIIDFIENLSI